jgi:hypothetical protein
MILLIVTVLFEYTITVRDYYDMLTLKDTNNTKSHLEIEDEWIS